MTEKTGRTKPFCVVLSCCFWLQILPAQSQTIVFINEFHYDNASGDVGEAIEVAGPSGFDLTGWSIVAYNGSNGSTYGSTVDLDGAIPEVCNGFGVVVVEFPGLQNGPDGIALVDDSGTVIQFLSYEGSFTASGGPADGMTSTDIGFSESTSEPVGNSLQLSGTGTVAEDFSWGDPTPGTFGACNTGQTFTGTSTEMNPEINVERPAGILIANGGTDSQGNQTPGSPISVTYLIRNTGTAVLNINDITSTGTANVTVNDIAPANLVVPANGSESFVVTYTVTGAGPFSFELDISHNDEAEGNYGIRVTGNGISPSSVQITATKTDLLLIDNDNDGEPDPGDTVKYTVEINNSGTTEANGVIFSDPPDGSLSLVTGSVTTTQGTVITGNVSGEKDVVLEVGTINSGSVVVTITFEVTVKSPETVEEIVPEVCNQGTVSGSNFADVGTDDPDTEATGDVTCTPLANASITIIKDTQPDDAQDFSFTTTGGLTPESFDLDDDNDGTLSNLRVFSDVTPGVYTVTEFDPSSTGFILDNISFERQGAVAGTLDTGARIATINVSPGDTIVVIFTNGESGVQGAARDDEFLIPMDEDFSGHLFADNGNGPDSVGIPPATIDSFGDGSLGGTITTHAAGSSVLLAGGTLTVNPNGGFSLNGPPFDAGTFTFGYRLQNTAGVSDATVTIIVQSHPPGFSKSFSPYEIDVGGTSTLKFTIDNRSNGVPAVDLGFNDMLPSGVVIARPDGVANHCGGVLSAEAGASDISFSGGSVGAGTICTISVNVISSTVGTFTNTSGDLTSSLGNSGKASATLNVSDLSLPTEFLFVADKLVEMKRHSIIEGNIHSNNDIKIKKGKHSEIVGDLVAVDDVDIGRRNRIDGNVFAGDDIDNDGEINGVAMERARVGKKSLVDIPAFNTGRGDVEIRKKRWKSLDPGRYDKVEVSKGAVLLLRNDGNSGDYFIRKLEFEKKAMLSIDVINGPVTINISRELDFDEQSQVVIEPGGDSNSKLVTFNYRDDDKIKIQEGARVIGTINAPNARVVLEERSRFKGTIFAEKIEVESRVEAWQHGATRILTRVALADQKELEEVEQMRSAPWKFALEQNYPNPFNPSTTIGFSLLEPGEVTLAIYNLRGQVVRFLVSGVVGVGKHRVIWDGTDTQGMRVPSGLYVYRMSVGSFVATRKLILVR